MIDVNDALRSFLAERHRPEVCPCRKKHAASPLPPAPPGPANAGKATRKLREALERLREAEDENGVAKVQRELVILTIGLEAYRVEYERYLDAMSDWRSDACGACSVSLLAVAAPGCARCLSADAVFILDALQVS